MAIFLLCILMMTFISEINGDCLGGDIMYREGQSAGHLGRTCINDLEYSGTEYVCSGGDFVEKPYVGDCDFTGFNGEQFFCCQSGTPGDLGAAICITDRTRCQELMSDNAEVDFNDIIHDNYNKINDDIYDGNYNYFSFTNVLSILLLFALILFIMNNIIYSYNNLCKNANNADLQFEKVNNFQSD